MGGTGGTGGAGGAVCRLPEDPTFCIEACDHDADCYLDASCGGSDCDDSTSQVHPCAVEICGRGIDANCNGLGGPGEPPDPDCQPPEGSGGG